MRVTTKPAVAKPAVVASAAAPAEAGRLDVKGVTAEVQKRYDGAADFKARFSQTLTSAAMGRKTSSSGEVTFKKPGRMRWDYQKPDQNTYVTDGKVLWLYEPDDKQAFKQELRSSQLPAALAFLTGQGKLNAEFDIAFATAGAGKVAYGVPGDYVLSLSPKTAQPQVKAILFVVDPHTFDVRESVITDAQGNVNDLVFSDIRVNTKVPDALFKWTPPAGVRVIDTAKLGK
jgi:outer membrane lipoprotein carrier protein